ncbi:O-antigen ligase family protein [Methyloversatilis thermotolerans]|uniref:O-antigen ligase family protein n=1 Tax=Methyloversatilis thermotolerans TaxID=1346290 RepID=UPI00036AD337|nr:O-antigen ligase family protein [Methyloversatilis thermotolerans]
MIQTTHPRTLLQRTPVLLGKAVLLAGFGFILFLFGVASALFPQFSARLAPFLAIGVVFFVALLASRDTPISERFRLWWMTALLVIFALWPTYMIIKVGKLPALDGRRVIVGLSIVLTFYLLVSRGFVAKALLRPQPGPLKTGFWIITVLMLLRLASCFVSKSEIYSVVTVAWEIFYFYSIYFISALFFTGENFQGRFLRTTLVLVLLIGFYVFVERVLERNFLADIAPETQGLEDLSLAMQQGRVRDGQFRTQGTFEHPLVMAEFMAMAFCFGMAAVLWPGPRFEKFLGWIVIFAAPICIWFSGTRAGLLALGAGLGVVLLLRFFSTRKKSNKYEKSMRKFAFFMVAAGALAVVTPTVLLIAQGRSAAEGSSTQVRMMMIELARPAIKESPLLGSGAGTAGAVAGIKTGSGVTTLDSHLLALTVESGVPALIVFMLIFLYPAWVILEKMLSGTLTNPRFVAATAGALSVVFMFRAILWIPYNMAIVFMMVAIALAACQPKEEHAA